MDTDNAHNSDFQHRNLCGFAFSPSTSCGAPVEFSLSPGGAPLSLLSVSEVCPAPFLMGSNSASPFSSGVVGFLSASGLLAGTGAMAEVKTGGRGTGLLLRGAECRAWSPAG